MYKRLLTLAAVAVLSGCSSLIPMEYGEDKPVSEERAAKAAEAMSEAWHKVGVTSEGRAAVVLITPLSIPDAVKSKKVTLELEPDATVSDVVAILGRLGVTAIIADEEAAKKKFFLPRFNGTVGGLISAVSRSTDTWFTWHDGTILVSSTERVGVSVPQEEKFAEDLSKGLEGLGVKEKSIHWQSGMVVVSLTPSQLSKTKTFLERHTANAAIINLQVAIINVTLNQTAKQGIDWESLQVSALSGGSVQQLNSIRSAVSQGVSNGVGSGLGPVADAIGGGAGAGAGTGAGASTDAGSSAGALGIGAVQLVGTSLTGAIFGGRFSFQGLFNFLSSYGIAETKQNVMLKTVAGNKVEFKSLMQIPYVSEVAVTTTSGSTNTGSALGSSKTAKADDGITVEMTPTYDAAANSVTIALNLSIKAVVAFNELSAGAQIGTFTQPTTAERSFNDTLRLRPGQTVVVGGLTYDSVSDNRTSPLFLAGTSLESQSLTVNRQTMFIVVRPTVLKLGQVQALEGSEGLAMLPDGTYEPEPEPFGKVKNKEDKKAKERKTEPDQGGATPTGEGRSQTPSTGGTSEGAGHDDRGGHE